MNVHNLRKKGYPNLERRNASELPFIAFTIAKIPYTLRHIGETCDFLIYSGRFEKN